MLNINHRCIGEQCVRAFATHVPTGTGSVMSTAQQVSLSTSSSVFGAACSHLSLLCLVQSLQWREKKREEILND